MWFCSRNVAKMLGYANYAEMSVSTKMASSVHNVLSMIDRSVVVVVVVVVVVDDDCLY